MFSNPVNDLVISFSVFLVFCAMLCDLNDITVSLFFKSFVQTVHHNAYGNDPYAKEFGIKISESLAQVEARVLPPPWVIKISYL